MRRTDVVQDDGSSAAAELASLEETFRGAAGKRALLLLSSFPFLIIGTVLGTADGLLSVEAETTHLAELEGKPIWIRLDAVEVFYIEDGQHPIPRLLSGPSAT